MYIFIVILSRSDAMVKIISKIKKERNNIVSILSTSIVGSIVSLIMTFSFANLITPTQLGTYQYIISIVSIIGVISYTGVLNGIIRAVSRHDFNFLPTAYTLLWKGSLYGAGVATCIGLYYLYYHNISLGLSIAIGGFLYLFTQVLYRYTSLFTALNEHTRVHMVLKLHAIAPLIFVLPFLLITDNPYLLTSLYFLGNACALMSSIWWTGMRKKEKDIFKNLSLERVKSEKLYISYSIHQSIITLISTVAVNIDKIILFQFLGPTQTAVYYVVTSIPNRIRSILKQFEAFLFAKFARHQSKNAKRQMEHWSMLFLFLVIPLYGVYALTIGWFFELFFSQYKSYAHLTIIYGLTLFCIVEMLPRSSLKAHAQNKTLYIVSVMTYVIHAFMVTIGVYISGLLGAVVGATISKLTISLMTYLIGKYHTPIPVEE